MRRGSEVSRIPTFGCSRVNDELTGVFLETMGLFVSRNRGYDFPTAEKLEANEAWLRANHPEYYRSVSAGEEDSEGEEVPETPREKQTLVLRLIGVDGKKGGAA